MRTWKRTLNLLLFCNGCSLWEIIHTLICSLNLNEELGKGTNKTWSVYLFSFIVDSHLYIGVTTWAILFLVWYSIVNIQTYAREISLYFCVCCFVLVKLLRPWCNSWHTHIQWKRNPIRTSHLECRYLSRSHIYIYIKFM